MATEHLITAGVGRVMGPGIWYRSRCTCGKYLSKLYGSEAGAMRAGNAHAKAKEGTT